MAYEGYLTLAGDEVVNNARAAAYCKEWGIQWGDCDPCAESDLFLEATCDAADLPNGYTDPVTDKAPWYDDCRPESERVLGVFGLAVTGLSDSTFTREPQELTGDGSMIGRGRRAAREITWQVAVIALDEEALSFGRAYLAAVLRSSNCVISNDGGGCGGDEACFFATCPCDADCHGCIGDSEFRNMYNVGLMEGPKEDEIFYIGGGGQCTGEITIPIRCDGVTRGAQASIMTFTLVAGNPHIYYRPLKSAPSCKNLHLGERVPNYDPDAVLAECASTLVDCHQDPQCTAPPLPPQPPVPKDPCYPTGKFTARRSLLTIEPDRMPDWRATVPVLQIESGSKEIRRLTIRWYENPAGQPCQMDKLDPCAACIDVNLNYLPPNSTLYLDGRLERAWVDCSPDNVGGSTATPILFGQKGQGFKWPVFECPVGFCIEVTCQDGVDPCAVAVVNLYPRADAT